jgi:hypothetical protein
MNKSILSAFFLVLAAAPVAAADIRLDSYRNPANERFRFFNRLYLDGARSGLISYNLWIETHGGQPLFCLPENLVMTTDQTEDIMLRSADKRAAKGDMLIAPLLLMGLQDTFSCENSGSR